MLYNGYKLFALPRDGGHFVRMRRDQIWPHFTIESRFFETSVFESELEAIQEAQRLVDDDPKHRNGINSQPSCERGP